MYKITSPVCMYVIYVSEKLSYGKQNFGNYTFEKKNSDRCQRTTPHEYDLTNIGEYKNKNNFFYGKKKIEEKKIEIQGPKI